MERPRTGPAVLRRPIIHPNSPRVWRIPELRTAFIHIPKCGSSFLSAGVNGRWPHDQHVRSWLAEWDAPEGWELLAHLRDPYDRLESAWRFLTRPVREVHLDHRKERGRPPETFSGFLERVLGIPDWERDQHVRSQWRTCCLDYHVEGEPEKFAPTHLVRWDFDELRRVFCLGPDMDRVVNPSTPRAAPEWPQELRTEFEAQYARDLSLWRAGVPGEAQS